MDPDVEYELPTAVHHDLSDDTKEKALDEMNIPADLKSLERES